MFLTILFGAGVITAISLLWRVFRYDDDNPLKKRLDTLPYLLQKPITCGICSTFWFALIYTAFAYPVYGLTPFFPSFEVLSSSLIGFAHFVCTWMIFGLTSISLYYVFLTFYEVSHYYAHLAHPTHTHSHPEEK